MACGSRAGAVAGLRDAARSWFCQFAPGCGCGEIVLPAVIQWGMLPLLAEDFHRVSLAGPMSNIPAVLLTGIIVPLGFLTLLATFLWARLALLLAKALSFCTGLLLATVDWFAGWPRLSYRIPGPPVWLVVAFFAAFVGLAVAARRIAERRRDRAVRLQPVAPRHYSEWTGGGCAADACSAGGDLSFLHRDWCAEISK